MKKTSLLILVSALATSSMALADTAGPVPRCTSGAANIEIYNKDIDTCADDGKSEYCIYDLELFSNDNNVKDCVDYSDTLTKNLNESYSLTHANRKASITHYLYTKGGADMANLHFIYDNGSFTNNCAELFGSDVKCVTTVSGPANHRLYKVTISQNN